MRELKNANQSRNDDHSAMITIDFETYSAAGYRFNGTHYMPDVSGKPGLKSINASTYAQHPSTEILSLAYEIDGINYLWIPGVNPPELLLNHIQQGYLIEAHNSLFEYYIWKYICHARLGWPELPLSQMRCSAAKARAYGLPGALGKISEILAPDTPKDPRGKRLIQLLSIPKRPTKKDPSLRRTVENHSDLYREMFEYNIQDVASEKAISERMPELSPTELEVWKLDQTINTRGIQIDIASLDACISLFELCQERYTQMLQELTDGKVKSVNEISKGSAGDKWLQSIGVRLSSLDKNHISEALASSDLPDAARKVFEIRQILGSSSIKKLYAIKRMVNDDGRLRDLFAYCGADRTGRFCIAVGAPVVVRLPDGTVKHVPIEDISVNMELWDGAEWVNHEGVVPAGFKEVVAYDGVSGTKDHRVYVSSTECAPLWDVILARARIFRGEKPCPLAMDYRYHLIAGEVMTYDIINAGPRNRFCVNGRIVHNSGRGAQPQNLKNSGPDTHVCSLCGAIGSPSKCQDCGSGTVITEWGPEAVDTALYHARLNLGLEHFTRRFHAPVDAVASCIRGLLVAKPGHDLICSDYSAIEAVVLAAVAKEEWRLEVFRTHGKIYEMSASKISGIPFEEILDHKRKTGTHHPLRKKIGKIAELGCFGKDTPVLTDSGWKRIVDISLKDRVHDGVEFVKHGGAIPKGRKHVLKLHGIAVTPEHPFYVGKGKWYFAVALKYAEHYMETALQAAAQIKIPTCVHQRTKSGYYADVYDILNCGPRSRFVINTNQGPLIAHNSGYGGWVNAWKNFGAGALMSDPEIKDNILKWRADSPAIVELWGGQWRKTSGKWEFTPEYYGLEGCAIQAILYPGYVYQYNGIRFHTNPAHDVLICTLPSGRNLYYHSPRLTTGMDQRGLSIWGISFLGGKGWSRIPTYGSKLTENVIQAISRDILVAAMLRVEVAGYPIVLHVHDEIVSEVLKGFGSVEEYEKLMVIREPWFADWPIKAAGGWRGRRYRK